jgi:hypothetical protein
VALLSVAFGMKDDDNSANQAPVPAVRAPADQRPPPPLVRKIRRHSPVGSFERATCRERPYTVQNPTRWFHPTEDFYPPGRDVPTRADLDHLVNEDGAVVVTYREDALAGGAGRAGALGGHRDRRGGRPGELEPLTPTGGLHV